MAVVSLEMLGDSAAEVEAVVETIVGYASGLNGETSFPVLFNLWR